MRTFTVFLQFVNLCKAYLGYINFEVIRCLDKTPVLIDHLKMTVATALKSLIENKVFLSTVFSLSIAQVLKLVFYVLKNRKNMKKLNAIETMLWRTGGMPSSHSAVVCALAASIAIYEGIASTYFIIALVFAMVVLRDAMGVRRTAGLQAKALNNLGKEMTKHTGQDFHTVKEIQGHNPLEVLVGSCLGILIAILFYLI
jgi:acid phosphatase family membrane protein YuiD